MKGIVRFAMLTVSLLGAMASCSDMEVAEVNGGYPEVITATIVEPDDPAQTRTCVDMSDTGNGYLGLLWQQNNSIGVYSQSGTTRNALFRSLTAGNAKQADFGGEMSTGDQPYRAYYPYGKQNDGAAATSLEGTLPVVQPFDPETGRLTGDYKYGAPVSGSKRFNFRHLFTLLRVSINAAGTPLEGDKLESIELTVTDSQGNARPICGDFKFSAVDGSWWGVENASGSVNMPWTTRPVLSQGETYLGFITVMPVVKTGDKIAVTVISEAHKASFTATCKLDFQAEHVYNIPLTLSGYAEKPEEFGYEVKARPVIESFGFSVSKNPGKILDKQLIWNSSNDPQFNTVSQQTATIQGDDISLMIPYLYHFKLIPEFTVSEGTTVTVDGVEQKSGETEVDFSKPVAYAVTANGETRHYTVNITNTGLPVVVLHQSATGDFSKVYQGGVTIGGTNIGGKLVNKFVDFMVRGKETDWVEDDTFTVYNADGTVNVDAAACGIRLRGNTTQTYPKKPFAVKLKSKKAVLDMPAHKRWVLLANWLDHSMIRNAVAFEVAHAMENGWKTGTVEQGIPWNVHGQNVELVMDGRHVGNYYLCEQIKIGGTRLDIQDAYEDALADGKVPATFENCGYLLELDNNYDENYKFITSHYSVPFMFKDDVLSDGILNAVKQKIQGIEDNIYAGDFASAYEDLDIYTVIDQWLIWELTMNHEYIEPRSVYYFMDGNGKLSAGPVWDFDRATFQNVENAQAQGSSGDRVKPYDQWICWSANPKAGLTASTLTNGSSCIWYPELITDPTFQKAVQERWTVMYPYLQGVVNNIRQLGVKMACSYEVNNAMWPTTKEAIHEHKSGFTDWSGDENIAAYSDVIDNFVTVYQSRLAGMNSLITSGKFTK